ncbi:lipid A biosynthesis acyltransferase [Litoribacillus peritrichatus]|uniref:Lipid A biosynthesis lauroyl acyltransferase n=1 Tax=Litoribacillus peritrichatus TaxID=718191 RepID=A0ABP7N6R5_9GAMM
MAKKHKFKPLWHPALIPSWMMVFVLYCISFLPMSWKQSLGTKLGRFGYKKLKGRVKVGNKNIAGCFPELSEGKQAQLVEDTFIACSKGFLETTHSWWQNVDPYVQNLKITGQEHLEEAKKRGNGVLLLGGHFSIFDIALPFFASQLDKPGYMYRPNDNPVIDRMIERGRRRHYGIQGFDKRRLKDMIQYIKEGGAVWYAADQDFGSKGKIFVPFFGVQTGCISTPSWIARESGATVMQVSQFRHPNGQYEIAFSPILEGFGQDEEKDAHDWNEQLEKAIRRYPDQYLWLHKRFKTRPKGEPSFY